MKSTKRERQLHKKPYRAVLGFLISFILLCFAGSVLFAKYYAGNSNKGVATASSLYFCSNFIKDLSGIKNENDYPIVYNTNSWNGEDEFVFDLEIRNYQNQLLFNDANLDIDYEITFKLEGDSTEEGTTETESTEESYTVTYTNGSGNVSESKQIDAEGIKFEMSGTLDGGQARSNTFRITIPKLAEGSDFSKKILVVATPTSPEYIAGSYKLGGWIQAKKVAKEYGFSSGFNIIGSLQDEGAWTEDDKKKIASQAALPYTIRYDGDENNATHTVRVEWNSAYVELNQYDDFFKNKQEVSEKSGWYYLEIQMEPSSTVNLVFYKQKNFITNVKSKSELENTVIVEDRNAPTNTSTTSQ